MKFFNIGSIRNKFFELGSFQVFILSFLICITFYSIEGILGIDRFYHPDSSHYLTGYITFKLKDVLNDPTIIFSSGYYFISQLLDYNYYLLILLNFFLYAFTNIFIYQKVFKRYFNKLNNLKLILLFYLFFLDPYRLHLASHVLKETILIFFMIIIIISNLKFIKIISIMFLEMFRPNAWAYVLIFINLKYIKKILTYKFFYVIMSLSIFLIIIFFLNLGLNDSIQDYINYIIQKIKILDSKTMPIRSYDHVSQFKDFNFPIGFLLKNIIWPILLISGFFIFFTSSSLFKFLGIVILLNNIFIYLISKKIFISLGLLITLFIISTHANSYTSMYRYSYIAIYSCIIYFFKDLNLKKIKTNNE